MNTTTQEVYVVDVQGREDGLYVFALREDAEKFAAAARVWGYAYVEAVPLIPGGGAAELIAAESDES